jgi:hypothetical protein
MINALGAMGSPCARPSKDIRARIESALYSFIVFVMIHDCHDAFDALPLKATKSA